MILLEHERTGSTWLKIRKHLEEHLEALRRKNDTDLDERATVRLRGRIAEVKALLTLGDERPQVVDADIPD